jgi:hypothetical protein
MKRMILIVFLVILSIIIVGCNSNPNPGPGPSPTPKKSYTIKILNSNPGFNRVKSLIRRGINSPGEPVTIDPSWCIFPYNSQVYTTEATIDSNGNIDTANGNPVICWAQIIDNDTGLDITNSVEPNQIIWTITDAEGIIYSNIFTYDGSHWTEHINKSDPIAGTTWYANANKPGLVLCSVNFQGATSSAEDIVQYKGKCDFGNVNATVGEWYDFENRQNTDNASNGDMKYISSGGINYIYAPYGISLLLNQTEDPYGNGVSVNMLGAVIQLPTGLTWGTQVQCQYRGIYALKTRNGKYVVLDNFLWSDTPNEVTNFEFKISNDGNYTAHW